MLWQERLVYLQLPALPLPSIPGLWDKDLGPVYQIWTSPVDAVCCVMLCIFQIARSNVGSDIVHPAFNFSPQLPSYGTFSQVFIAALAPVVSDGRNRVKVDGNSQGHTGAHSAGTHTHNRWIRPRSGILLVQKSSDREEAVVVLYNVCFCGTRLENYEKKPVFFAPKQVLPNELHARKKPACPLLPPSGILNWQDLNRNVPRLDPSLLNAITLRLFEKKNSTAFKKAAW